MTVRDRPVSKFVIRTVTLGTAAPEESCTVPKIVASTCAHATAATNVTTHAAPKNRRTDLKKLDHTLALSTTLIIRKTSPKTATLLAHIHPPSVNKDIRSGRRCQGRYRLNGCITSHVSACSICGS